MEENFIEKVNKCIGQIATINYYEPNTQEMVTEQIVIAGFKSNYLSAVVAFNNSFFTRVLPLCNIECISATSTPDTMFNPDFNQSKKL